MQWLYIRTGLRPEFSIRLLHLHLREVSHQLLQRFRREPASCPFHRSANGIFRPLPPQQIQTKPVLQVRRQLVCERIQLRKIVLAQRKDRPDLRFLQQRGKLSEKLPPRLKRCWIRGENFLELVEDQNRVPRRRSSPRPARHIFLERHSGNRALGAPQAFRHLRLERKIHAPHVSVRRAIVAHRQAHPRWRPHVELLRQPRQQPCLQQRALARARRRMKQDDALRAQQVIQAVDLRVAPEDRLSSFNRPRSDERIRRARTTHRRLPAPLPSAPRRPAPAAP